MKEALWNPTKQTIENANITKFIDSVNKKHNLGISNYNELYRWSIDNIEDFWAAMWEFGDIRASKKYRAVVDDLGKFPGADWFPEARLNFAENLLRHRDESTALIFKGETRSITRMTYAELYNAVAVLSDSLRNIGVQAGDRIASYMPNTPDTAIAMLATTSIGAVWSSCGTGLGPKAVLDRFEQVEPRVLFTVDSYSYKGKDFDVLSKAEEVANGIPSIEKTVVVPYLREEFDISSLPHSILYSDFTTASMRPEIQFEQLPFGHPVYIMFSSGTTGRPKCMVQSAGGVLIKHLKELLLHTDLKREDRMFYTTSPSWMMWNWMLSSLAVGATVVLYDGNPNYPDWRTMWQLIQDERVTIFGCSATYINYLKSQNARPREDFDLSSLREISQTGSALSAEGFQYVYKEIKEDLHFNSISGGTDINGCFAAGTPIQPVYAGELQGPCLGMRIRAYDEEGNSVLDQEGELVCEAPAPSMPLYFWDDSDGTRYKEAYFNVYPNVWHHGDWIIMHVDTGGLTFLGRSDFTLKPSGVRIGPSEIYNVIEEIREIADSIVVGQNWAGDQRILLFVKLTDGVQLTEELKQEIRRDLRVKAGPRHVPELILEVQAIPYTFSMKKVESAVWNIVNNRPVTNRDAISNPESLDHYQRIVDSLK
ncbi:MAG: acetoacetate--CoA ligase [Candidatus Thorarchaeota archaeon]|nr:MAG: acetoacetate--CoA ligase [Candidatus Thorarchaeota archaeon]